MLPRVSALTTSTSQGVGRRRGLAVLILGAGVAVAACGGGRVDPPDAGVDPWIHVPPPPPPRCTEGDTRLCYSGGAGTLNIGACQPGTQTCVAGHWSNCEDEVLPSEETCATPVDDDCDGQVNEEGPDCGCTPNEVRSCYSGPAGAIGVGPCTAGTQTCNASGTGFGPCEGEVLPQEETCATPVDDDCDGLVNEEGEGCVCTPGETSACYTGPAGTEGVGLCAAGVRTCNAQGNDYGPCVGEVTPAEETCHTPDDDDCDGQLNEGGAGCVCIPGDVRGCYTGPAGTLDVGVCKGGGQACNALGTAWGPCTGEVTPQVDDCQTPEDENCDGQTPSCNAQVPIIDLRADVNRNGVVDLQDPTEDANEETFTATHGAVFLANIDDDQDACPTNVSDSALAACHDAADNVVNGAADLLDLARLKTVPWPDAPANASATLTVSSPGAAHVRLFKKSGTNFVLFTPGSPLSSAELQAGVEFAIEGKDLLRNANTWDGVVDLTLNVVAGTGPGGQALPNGSDTVRMKQAPVIFRHHLDEAERVYATALSGTASQVFRQDLSAAITAAGVQNPLMTFPVSDQWTQDFFETAYMSMPAPGGGQKVIHVNFRSANYTGSLRAAGKVVYTLLRGPDVAGATSYSTTHNNQMDTLNSFGNLETLPPYTHNGVSRPLGKVIRGSVPSFYTDPTFDAMVAAQGVQGLLYVDTSWLAVAHIDETVSFVKANSPRGWVMLATDPVGAKAELQAAQAQGYGTTPMFVGKYWSGGSPAQVSINNVLNDPDVMNISATAAVEIDAQVNAIQQETGLQGSEIVAIGGLFQPSYGYALAFEPGMVNGIYLSDTDFGAPRPHGPVINGQDLFRHQMESALSPHGITVRWIENWDLYHRLSGEVHCGSNTTRVVPANIKWWESGL